MKSKKFASTIALLLLGLSLCAGTSFATTYPLNAPLGLALDAKGNLYVANNVGNQILVYSPSYVQQTKKTISTNVSNPVGVAIDVIGNIWVVNGGYNNNSGSVTVYSPTGVQDPSRTLTNQVFNPSAIAADAVGNVWIVTGNSTIVVFPVAGLTPPAPIKTIAAGAIVSGLAAHNMWIAWGSYTATEIEEIGPMLSGAYTVYGAVPSGAYAVAYDAAGNLYTGGGSTNYTAINVTNAITNVTSELVGLSYFPFGIAIDNARGRIYVADGFNNKIDVFNMSGVLQHTIQ